MKDLSEKQWIIAVVVLTIVAVVVGVGLDLLATWIKAIIVRSVFK